MNSIRFTSLNPIHSAFQSIWAQMTIDEDLMDAYRIEDSTRGEDKIIATLYRISESLPSDSDSGDLEAAFWKDALP